jgi:hypothetical protein
MRHVATGANEVTNPWPISEENTVSPLSERERDIRNIRKKQG